MYGFFATRRMYHEQRLAQLKAARSSWEPAWREITEMLLPYRTVWYQSDRGRGDKKDSAILNSKPIKALDGLAAGLQSGVTSPSRKWFNLTLPDRDLANSDKVKDYLDQCEEVIYDVLQMSDWYASLSNAVYPDLGGIGTSAMLIEEIPGERGKVRFRPLPIGEYFLDVDTAGAVDTCYREIWMPVRQVVQEFGLSACSQNIRLAYERGDYMTPFRVVHAIEPNSEYRPGSIGPKGKEASLMKFSSCWWETTDERQDAFLRESGYEEFPVLAPRWSVRPGDIYGRGPGWTVRGDCRMLQHHERRRMQMIDKIVNPPLRVHDNIKRASLLPGDVTHVPIGQVDALEPIMMIDPKALEVLDVQIERVEQRIDSGMHADLLRRLVDDDRNARPTATEVEALRQEAMLQFGPVLENLNGGLLEPGVERLFAILARNDMLPPAPEELLGQSIKVEFISIMHQMQKSTTLIGLRTLTQETQALAAMGRSDALDKLDVDIIMDELGEITGVPSAAILSKDEVAKVREVRAHQQQAQQQGQAMLAATQGAKNLSGVDPTKLADLAGSIAPAMTAAQGAA